MPVVAEDLEQFAGQKVVVVYTPSGKSEAVEAEGTAEAANIMGIVFKLRGRQNSELIEVGQLEEVRFAPEKLKELKQQDLTPVKYGSARKHLLDRHGITLEWVNKTSEEDALTAHAASPHGEIGHQHVEKKVEEKKDEAAA